MATSNSYDWSSTRNDLIQNAMRKIGALGDHQSISADTNKLNVGIAEINPTLRFLAAKGMPLWAMEQVTVPFSHFTSTAAVTFGPAKTMATSYRPLKVVHAIRRDSTVSAAPVDTDMTVEEYTSYLGHPSKATTGTPLFVYHKPLAYHSLLNVWPLPDSNQQTNGSMILWVQREFQDFDSATDEPDFPKEWVLPFTYALAYQLAPIYGLPPNDRQALLRDMQMFISEIEGFGVEEGSYRIQPRKR